MSCYYHLSILLLCFGLVISNCVNNCSNHGTCESDQCRCNTGYVGSDCSIWDHEIQNDQSDSGHLNTFQWHYYHVNLPNGARLLTFDVYQTSEFGDIDVYVGKDYLPDTKNHFYKDQSTSRYINVALNNVESGTWEIGLYGYWSSDYNITCHYEVTCSHDCGEHGYCSGTSCACYLPYTGDDCSIFDLQITSGEIYSGSVETREWMYYHIDVRQGQQMGITVTQESSNYDLDVYVKLGQRPQSRTFDYLNATVAPTTEMNLMNLNQGVYEIGIYGYSGGSYTLQVIVGDTLECISDCSHHGTCSSGHCSCDANYSGLYCEHYDLTLDLGEQKDGYVMTGYWNYWTITYFTQSSLVVDVLQTNGGDCDVYIQSGTDPSRFIYKIADLSTDQAFSVIIQDPENEDWHIGVYGWTTCAYSLVVNVLEECQCNDQGHGHCAQGSPTCHCDVGWAGPACDIVSFHILNSQIKDGQVERHNWAYYYFTSDSRAVSVTMVESDSVGYLWLFLSYQGYPTGENYDYIDASDSSFHEIHIAHYEAPGPIMYFIGVTSATTSLGDQPLAFQITAYGTPF